MDKRFSRDCAAECPHFYTWELSIGNWVCVCDLLQLQINECDMDFKWEKCPLKEGK